MLSNMSFNNKEKFIKLIRYSLVGLLVAFVYMSLYLILYYLFRFSNFYSNFISFFVAVMAQYYFQTVFTFRQQLKDLNKIARFLLTVTVGYLVSQFITGFMVPRGIVSEYFGLALVVLLLPILNLFIMFLWVFVEAKDNDLSHP